MTAPRDAWIAAIHPDGDPYAGLVGGDSNPQGWGAESAALRVALERARPGRILEIGTWRGASAIRFAREGLATGLDPSVLCVDTWLGSREMVGVRNDHPTRGMGRERGWPTVYQAFLANVVAAGVQDRVVPFPQTSRIALHWLADRGEWFDLVYVDASHDRADVRDDALGAWDLLRPGGILLGDDWSEHWPGVERGVHDFLADTEVAESDVERIGDHWLVVRP